MTETTSGSALRGHKAIWRLEQPFPDELRSRLSDLSPMLCHLLYCRDYRTPGEIESFFTGARVSHDPFLLPDMDLAMQRITQAIRDGEQVAVYGDFDCDGISAAVILEETLRACGLRPITCIPTRGDGHGLHPEMLAALADRGVDLIITADCGVCAIEEVQVAQGMGMDIIVTDHHEPRADGSLPPCPTICPTRHDSEYPFRSLCGAGVAYKLGQALARTVPMALAPEDLLDLVALGTVADVVALRDENRSLVVRGLQRLRQTERPGLLALFRAAGIDRGKINPVTVGFYLAPRLNAANRMATPQLAYDLITATDEEVAARLAAQLSAYNQQRQLLVAAQLEVITRELGEPSDIADEVLTGRRAPLLIVVGAWPAGISGLLASKLVDLYGLPAFVGTETGEGTVSVSARGLSGVNIDELLEGCEASLPGGLFLGYGGHSGAGGFRVASERLEVARSLLAEQARQQVRIDEVGAVLTIDAEVQLSKLNKDAAEKIQQLAPFGSDFPEPLFLARGVRLTRRSIIGDNRHARFTLQNGRGSIGGVYFNMDGEFPQLALESRLDVVFHLQMDEWNGRFRPEIRLRDWRLVS